MRLLRSVSARVSYWRCRRALARQTAQPELDCAFYRAHHPDLQHLSDAQLQDHWRRFGRYERRAPNLAVWLESEGVPSELLTHGVAVLQRLPLVVDFYRAHYPDLNQLSDVQLRRHWMILGWRERRAPNLAVWLESEGVPSNRLNAVLGWLERQPLDSRFYRMAYPDLCHLDEMQLRRHWQVRAWQERRAPNEQVWLEQARLPESLQQSGLSLAAILQDPRHEALNLDASVVLASLHGQRVIPFYPLERESECERFYLELAQWRLSRGEREQGRHLLQAACRLFPASEAYQRLAESYYLEGRFDIALPYYQRLIAQGRDNRLVRLHHANALVHTGKIEQGFELLCTLLDDASDWTVLEDAIGSCVEQAWLRLHGRAESLLDQDDRPALIEAAEHYAAFAYQAFQRVLSRSDPVALGELDLSRVLIVGDYHVKQCVRYRIEQKREQLEAQGIEVAQLDWLKLERHSAVLLTYDVVIFYRLPAAPSVLKAMAQVNALGHLSIYETDDLLFVSDYPPPLQSYGGAVDYMQYRGLLMGMAVQRAAIRYCRFGLGSTKPLQAALQPLVFGGKVWLHRNGLDSLNHYGEKPPRTDGRVTLFYGSGTLAHNSDFIEQLLPALVQVLDAFPQTQLCVVGYLRLPGWFQDRYPGRLHFHPPTWDMDSYWQLLSQADINLAVLHRDPITDCKSELKWFEAACFEVPSVVSETQNYRDVLRPGEDALLATSPEQWYQAIARLVEDPVLRHRMGKAAKQRVLQEYSLSALGQGLQHTLQAMSEAGAGKLPEPRTRPKVALVNVFFPPQSIGGATRVVADNFELLRERYADELTLCVFTADAECRRPYQLSRDLYQGVPVYRATTRWREHMDWQPWDSRMGETFAAFLAYEKPDLIHFHCVQRLSASLLSTANSMGVPYVVTVHDAWWISDFQFLVDGQDKVYPNGHLPDEVLPLPKGISQRASRRRRRDLKAMLHKARRVLTVSDSFAEIYRRNGIEHVEVVKNGIADSLAQSRKSTGDEPRVIGAHVGGMSAHKGYDLLREAVLVCQPANMAFIVVDHSKPAGYRLESSWGEVPVTFVGRYEQDKIVDLYTQIDVLFAPSIWPESFGLVTREAAACGCWVVASNRGGIGEDVLDGVSGFVIEPELEALIACLEHMDQNHARYKHAAPAPTTQRVEQQVANLVQIYKDIR